MLLIRDAFLRLSLAGSLLVPVSSAGQSWGEQQIVGSFVTVSVEVDGTSVPLYPALDGSGRYYLEACEGSHYALHVVNRTSERLGVMLAVDGLNVISGERQTSLAPWGRSRPGRMYVLDPWEGATVSGWRTSLEDVRRFTFVDERASYAARSGKANGKMGWIELFVYRERDCIRLSRESRITPAPPAPAAKEEAAAGRDDDLRAEARARGPSYPGTGWGPRAQDPAVVVEFKPERKAAERITLRYEYEDVLVSLGILPRPWHARDRLAEREQGRDDGFAQPTLR